MHAICLDAKNKLAAAEKWKAEQLAAADPVLDPEGYERIKAIKTRDSLLAVNLDDWKQFLREHKPPADSPAAALHEGLAKAAVAAAKFGSPDDAVHVKAVDVIAIHEACET